MMRAQKLQAGEITTLPAPSRGWAVADNFVEADPRTAQVLENWLPTTRGARLRKGIAKRATLDAAVTAMAVYRSGTETLFGMTAADIYDITSPASTTITPAALLEQLSGGDWSAEQTQTAGGQFLVMVNGEDYLVVHDGTGTYPVLGVAVTSISYDALSAGFTIAGTLSGSGGGSGTIVGIRPTTATTGTLYVTGITGTFSDNDALTDGGGGAATQNGASAATHSFTITGVDTNTLSHVWKWGSRLFFVEKDSLKAWYLPASSVGGAAASITLGSVFLNGGTLLFGASWSTADAGDGMDDKCVFVTAEGEVAVYEGTDPASASTWRKVGVYDIGKPLGKNAWIRAGGDLVIATEQGFVPLSQAVMKDPTALSFAAVSRQIEPEWRRRARDRTADWCAVKSTKGQWSMVATDDGNFMFNLQTGGPALWTGWDVDAAAEFGGTVYFGGASGIVYEAESGGSDDGAAYECRMAGAYNHLGLPSFVKQIHMVRGTFLAQSEFTAKVSVSADYNVNFPSAPSASTSSAASVFDTAVFDTATFYAPLDRMVTTQWRSVGRSTRVLSPQVQVTCSDSVAPEVELASVDVLYHPGGSVV